jgi:hypothetical protein
MLIHNPWNKQKRRNCSLIPLTAIVVILSKTTCLCLEVDGSDSSFLRFSYMGRSEWPRSLKHKMSSPTKNIGVVGEVFCSIIMQFGVPMKQVGFY